MCDDATRFSGSLKGEFSRSRFPAFPLQSCFGWTRFLLSSRSPLLFSQPRTVVTFDFLWFSFIFRSFSRSLPRPVAFRASSRFQSPQLPHSITSFSRSLIPREYLLFLSRSLWFASQRFLDSSPIVFPFCFPEFFRIFLFLETSSSHFSLVLDRIATIPCLLVLEPRPFPTRV